MGQNKKFSKKPTLENRQAKFNYELFDSFDAGISLEGWEIKSIRASQADLKDGYVLIKKGEAWLIGMSITPLPEVTHKAEPLRTRKLLLTKSELSKIFKLTQEKGLTCIPIRLFWKENLVKLTVSLGKGKSKFDNRQSIKKREWDKEKAKTTNIDRNFK